MCTLLSSRPGLCGQGVRETTTKNYKGLSEVLVAVATLIQMFIDWKQSNAIGLEKRLFETKAGCCGRNSTHAHSSPSRFATDNEGEKVGRCGEEETVFAEH